MNAGVLMVDDVVIFMKHVNRPVEDGDAPDITAGGETAGEQGVRKKPATASYSSSGSVGSRKACLVKRGV